MNLTRQQSVFAGIALIALGLVWWLGLWWLVFPLVLATLGVVMYAQRRAMGRTVEAVQSAIWGVGMAIMALISFFIPGLLIVGGASLLARGKEDRIDAWIQSRVARVRRPSGARPTYTRPTTPTPLAPPTPTVIDAESTRSNDTVRL